MCCFLNKTFFAAAVFFILTGCIEVTVNLSINPSGSALAGVHVSMLPEAGLSAVRFDNETEKFIGRSARMILSSARGAAWKSARWDLMNDGRFHFYGEAFIEDISKAETDFVPWLPVSLIPHGSNIFSAVFAFEDEQIKKIKPKQEESRKKKKPAAVISAWPARLSEILLTANVRINGHITNFSRFESISANQVSIKLEGEKLLKNIDAVASGLPQEDLLNLFWTGRGPASFTARIDGDSFDEEAEMQLSKGMDEVIRQRAEYWNKSQ